jgi:hypothetical protein
VDRTGGTVKAIVVAALLIGIAAIAPRAEAQERELTIGLFAPSAPFSGPAQRLEFVRGLADHVAAQTGRRVLGRVFANGSALAGAMKSGEVQFAVLDAVYAAQVGMPYEPLAAAVRGDSALGAWHLVGGPGVRSLADLRGKIIAVPGIGPRDSQFVTNALLDGEVDAGYFAKIATAPDASSAVTMIGVGRAQGGLVPASIELPGGVRPIVGVGSIGLPMFVAAPGVDRATTDRVSRAVRTFQSAGPFTRFTSPDAGRYRSIVLSRPSRKGPMAVPPPARLNVREILEGRSFALEPTPILSIATAPDRE